MGVSRIPQQPLFAGPERFLIKGPFLLDLETRSTQFNDRRITLPPCAFNCLVILVQHSPEPVSYQALVQDSLGIRLSRLEAQDYARWRIERLREAIEPHQLENRFFRSVAGFGYRLVI